MNVPKFIDIHSHIWGSGVRLNVDQKKQLVAAMDRFNAEGFVVLPLFGEQHPSPEEIRIGNDEASKFAREDNRVIPFVTVHPWHGERALKELRHRMEDQQFAGMKIWVSHADQPNCYPLIEQMIAYGKPSLIHALHKSVGQLPLESDATHIARLANRYPEAKILMAHIGGNFIHSCGAIADCPNVWTDPSGSYCETGMLEYAVRMLGAGRIVFGSDAPNAGLINNIAKVMAADLNDADKHRIMYANAKELLS